MLSFNDLLQQAGFDLPDVAVILHTPGEPKLRAALAGIVQTRRAAFEEFQRSHSPTATATLRKRPIMASFVGVSSGGLVFVGIYRRLREWQRTFADRVADPEHRFLQEGFGYAREFDAGKSPEQTHPYFDFELLDSLGDMTGRLVIEPKLTRTYVRRAENLHAPIAEVSRESLFNPQPPPWREWVLSSGELRVLPEAQAIRLREWRGVYLIVDETDGARYVGSAYGTDNLWGRWQAHVSRDRGITAELRHRNPANFRFSILERVSPDMPVEDVIGLEHSWMRRLSTREFGLNA